MMEVHLSCSLWLVRPRSIPKASNANEMPMKKEGLSLCDPAISLIYHRNQRQSITRNSYFFVCSKKGRKEGVVPFKFSPNMKPLEWGWALDWIPQKPDSLQPLLRPRTPGMSSPSSETCRWVSTSPDDPPDAGNLMDTRKKAKRKRMEKTNWATPVTPVDSVGLSLSLSIFQAIFSVS